MDREQPTEYHHTPLQLDNDRPRDAIIVRRERCEIIQDLETILDPAPKLGEEVVCEAATPVGIDACDPVEQENEEGTEHGGHQKSTMATDYSRIECLDEFCLSVFLKEA